MRKHYIEDKIRQGYRVYNLKDLLGEYPTTGEIDKIIERLGPGKLGEVDSNDYLYVKTDPTWTDISKLSREKG